jgi:NNP family nitrate/nitrite transporter-like MFS transporter
MAQQAVIFTRRHNWLMCWLYLGTFGSFIGFAASLPMLAQSQFHRADALHLVWLGPLIGAVLRPLGGWMADRWGGARVTLLDLRGDGAGRFTMALVCLPATVATGQPDQGGSFARLPGCVWCALRSLGHRQRQHLSHDLQPVRGRAGTAPCRQPAVGHRPLAANEGAIEAAAALGFASAIGAYGGFFIPKSVGSSLAMTGSASAALVMFIVFYLSCIALTWWACSRRNAPYPC